MKRAALIVGHRETARGAERVIDRIPEYDFNSTLATEVAGSIAIDTDIACDVVHKQDLSDEELALALNGVYDLAVEFHFNACGNTTARGSETLYAHLRSTWLAKVMHDAVCKSLIRNGKTDRGIKVLSPGDRGYTNLVNYTIPAIILEPYFGSTRPECAWFDFHRSKFINKIKEAAVEFYTVA